MDGALKKIWSWLKLSCAPQIGVSKAVKITRELGEPADFLTDRFAALAEFSFITAESLEYLSSEEDPPLWKQTAKILENEEIRFCSILDQEYPAILKQIADAPAFLFYRGNLQAEDFNNNLGVVGTRTPSSYGRAQCESVTRELVRRGFCIISGLAYGIDTLAHQVALENGGRTLAVLGSSIEQIYPPSNRKLAEVIVKHGALISEQIPGSIFCPWHFVQRNRIISGLSRGSWVVEGNQKSGALITAKFAREQQRLVFALPGDVTRATAAGPNQLLREGAIPVMDYTDVLKAMGISETGAEMKETLLDGLNDLEKRIYLQLLAEEGEVSFDRLVVSSGLAVGQLSMLLLSLELKGLVRNAAGNKIYPIK